MLCRVTVTATERRLATVETIADIGPIPDADSIVRARIRGWDVVVKVGEFEVGDPCVYFEIDSLLDVTDPRFAFLAARGAQTAADGRRGHVLKTARLRGQYSQGLALPLNLFPEVLERVPGTDVTTVLDVVKWEPPVPAQISGVVRGPRPSWIPATDEERIQNVAAILETERDDWIATEKLDGTSSTYYVDPSTGTSGVCGRNWDLLESEDNTLWRLGRRHRLHELIEATWPDARAAVQGEVYGEAIQANPLKVHGQHFGLFTIRVDGAELARGDWPDWALELSVPLREDLRFPSSVTEALSDIDGLRSAVSPDRPAEGVVWRALGASTVQLPDGTPSRASFKVLSNRYLLKHDR
ncbi:RNA ligase (ATP) [Antribacter gilvus]|uniref:RNA ligase (ATP) n=1 Tax=Antribacter gilvus TaxID=2304675 RepID=UPI000F77E21F|nr:RNA ligase (ATP) [Antribacter gilvus]